MLISQAERVQNSWICKICGPITHHPAMHLSKFTLHNSFSFNIIVHKAHTWKYSVSLWSAWGSWLNSTRVTDICRSLSILSEVLSQGRWLAVQLQNAWIPAAEGASFRLLWNHLWLKWKCTVIHWAIPLLTGVMHLTRACCSLRLHLNSGHSSWAYVNRCLAQDCNWKMFLSLGRNSLICWSLKDQNEGSKAFWSPQDKHS